MRLSVLGFIKEGGEADGLRAAGKSNMSVLLSCNETSSKSL